MNFNVANVSNIYHSMFYTTNIFILRRSSKRYFQRYFGSRITFTANQSEFFGKLYVCLKNEGSSTVLGSSRGCQYWLRQCGTTTTALILLQVIFASV